MTKILTAEEFLHSYKKTIGVRLISDMSPEQISNYAIEFTKLHVKAAIETCIEEAPSGSSTDTVSYEDVVKALKDCYPESNIK